MSGGYQEIKSGGTGTVDTMNSGNQYISSGAAGTIGTMSGGYQEIKPGGMGTIGAMEYGDQNIDSGGTGTVDTMNSGNQNIYNGTGIVIAMNGGTQTIFSGGTGTISSLLGGEQLVLNGGTALDTELNGGSLQISSGGIVSSLTLTSGSLELENINGGNFTVSGTLTANNATVDMTDSSIKRVVPSVAYETLTIDKLSGNGTTFIMDTDLSGETNSDKITITDADAGTHYVQIKDLSRLNDIEVTGAHQQILITDASGKLTFEGKEFNAGGLWDVDPTLAKQGNNW